MKAIINPDGPTPSGFAYYLPRPDGNPVSFDDCQWRTGFVFEIKGETYSHLLSMSFGKEVQDEMLKQSASQLAASGGRPVIWVFAEAEAAQRARDIFNSKNNGREMITVLYIPWVRSKP